MENSMKTGRNRFNSWDSLQRRNKLRIFFATDRLFLVRTTWIEQKLPVNKGTVSNTDHRCEECKHLQTRDTASGAALAQAALILTGVSDLPVPLSPLTAQISQHLSFKWAEVTLDPEYRWLHFFPGCYIYLSSPANDSYPSIFLFPYCLALLVQW